MNVAPLRRIKRHSRKWTATSIGASRGSARCGSTFYKRNVQDGRWYSFPNHTPPMETGNLHPSTKGYRIEPAKYRPVALLFHPRKIIEGAIRLDQSQRVKLNALQCGNRAPHITTTVLFGYQHSHDPAYNTLQCWF